MKNVDINHHPYRGNFTVTLISDLNESEVMPYFRIIDNKIVVDEGLVVMTNRGIRIERLGQGVFLREAWVKKINAESRRIWPEYKFLRFIKDLWRKITTIIKGLFNDARP